jgi:two-component sensor histidine kinase
MFTPSNTRRTPDVPLTWVRGSFLAAYRSFWLPWSERSGPILAHVLLALSLNALVGAAIALAVSSFDHEPVARVFGKVVPYCMSIGISIMALQGVGEAIFGVRRLRALTGAARTLYWAAVATSGAYAGFLVASYLRWGSIALAWNPVNNIELATSLGLGLIITYVAHSLASNSGRAIEAHQAAERERLRTLAAEAAAVEARLKLLQAQIEPHFLFNTLANIVSLIESRPVDAKDMLEDLIRYLRATLALTRQEKTTLGAEAEVMQAYLSIFRYRMGDRLSFAIDVEPSLRGVAIAPMLLQPLVENALKHGLEPKIDGGAVTIVARREPGSLAVEVTDTGLGFQNASGALGAPDAGFGLLNVRERLALQYGDGGRLEIRERGGGGTVARLTIPTIETL